MKFLQAERFCQISISTQFDALQPVADFRFGSKHDDRHMTDIGIALDVFKQRDMVNQEINRFEQENQRRPSVEELSARTGVDEDKISQSMMASGHHVSIDAPFGEDDDNSMADVMSSGDDSRTDKHVDHESMAQELKQVLNKCLKERERKIVCACFGIDETEKGLEEIGDKMGLTRERVRQIREKSITKLRESGKIGILMKYLG